MVKLRKRNLKMSYDDKQPTIKLEEKNESSSIASVETEKSHHPVSNFFKKISRNVTIEPMLFLKMVAEGNFVVVGDTLEIDRVCRVNLGFNATDCQLMDDGNHTDIQNSVQKYQNTFNYHQSLMDSFIPLIVILFLGPMSDKYGRKPAMITVLVGFICMSLVYILEAAFENWPVQVLYLATLSVDLGGTWVVFNMVVYSYLADITSAETRTKRMGIADAVWYMGAPVGTFIGGIVYKHFGYIAVYATSTVLWTLCLLYTLLFIKEKQKVVECEPTREINCGPFNYVIDLFKTGFKSRPNNGRTHLLVLIGLKLGVFFIQGHQMYLWARKVLQWDATQYSTWSSAEQGAEEVSMVGWLWLVEKFNFHDCTTAGFGIFSLTLWSVTLACITGPSLWWLVIVASTLGLLEASIEPAIRSMLTVIVGLGEEGKVLTLLGLLEAAWLSVDRLLYTQLYNHYVDNFPQIDFVVQATFGVILIGVVILLKRSMQKKPEEEFVVGTAYTIDNVF